MPTPDIAGRDASLSLFEIHREDVVQALRDRAGTLWYLWRKPLSVNDVRPVLAEIGYTGDPRILGAVFTKADWRPVGWVTVAGGKAHARPVRTFVPRTAVWVMP